MLMAGNNIFCLDTARPNEIEKLITSTDDGDLLQKVIDSNHYLYYIMLQSSMGGSGAEDVVVSDAAPVVADDPARSRCCVLRTGRCRCRDVCAAYLHGRFLRGKAEESCRQKELMEVEPDE